MRSSVMSLQQQHDVGIQGAALEMEPCFKQHTARSSNKVAPAPTKDQHVTISHAGTLLRHTVDDQKIDPVTPGSREISPELRAALKCLGMTDGALMGWHTFHVSPVRAMLYFFISACTLLGALAYLHYGTPRNFLYIRIPCIGSITFLIVYIGAIWRYGPAAAKNRVYIMTLPLSWTCSSVAFVSRWDPRACSSSANKPVFMI
jgi:hypothetical protein